MHPQLPFCQTPAHSDSKVEDRCSPGALTLKGSMRACTQPLDRECWLQSHTSRDSQASSLSAAISVAQAQACRSSLALTYGREGIQIGVRLWYLGPLAFTTGMSCMSSTPRAMKLAVNPCVCCPN
jgi:hypothetical protein